MSNSARIQRAGTAAGLAVAVLMFVCRPGALWAAAGGEPKAAEAEFVGVIALAVEDPAAKELGLTDAQREKLQKLIESREDSQELTELVLTLKDLAPADREAKLAPFRRETEALGLAVLSPEQQTRLQQIRVRRAGLAALAEAPVAEDLALTAEQRGQVDQILKERGEQLKGADQARMHVIRAETERRLAGVLTPHQRTAWETLSGGIPGGPPAAGPAEKTVAAPPNPENIFGAGAPKPVPGTTEGAPAKPPAELPAKPAPAPGEGAAPKPPAPAPGKLRFNFKAHPWAEVIQWFASNAGYSYVSPDLAPQGTFSYIDDRDYTPAQAIDLLNSVLLIKGYTLNTRGRMLFLIPTDKIPDNLVVPVPLKDLDQKGEFELTCVVFPLERLTAEKARDEIQGLMGPQGKIVVLPESQMIQVTETGGRLRAVRSVIDRIEGPGGPSATRLRTFTLKFATPGEVLSIARPLFGIKAEEFSADDGSIRLAVDAVGKRILASGKPDKLAQLEEILKTVDVSPTGDTGEARTAEKPQLVIYPITIADPESVLKVMQTLLAGEPDARLAIDPRTGSLVAMALPSQHAAIIRPTLEQYEGSARHVEVIHLRVVDPQMAVLAINKLFGAGDSKQPNPNAPQVDADPINHLLLVRATTSEIAQMRILLEKMGETDTTQGALASGGGSMRIIPLPNTRTSSSAVKQVQEFWPFIHPNIKIRVVTPSAVAPTIRSRGEAARPGREEPTPEETIPAPKKLPRTTPPLKNRPATDKAARSGTGVTPVAPGGARVFLVAQAVEAEPEPVAAEPSPDPGAPPPKAPAVQPEDSQSPVPKELPEPAAKQPQAPAPKESEEPGEIVVATTPGGVIIMGPPQALDEFERTLKAVMGSVTGGGDYPTIFYLKYAKAPVIAQTLDQLLGGGTLASSGSRGGSMMGELAGAALGDTAGGIIGALLDGGGGVPIAPSGTIRIVPEARLNALFVHANDADLDLIEQYLNILDQPQGPEEVLVFPQSRIIPVYNTQAERIAEIVKVVYQDRLITGAGAQQRGGGAPSPEQFIEMLRGGRGGPGGRGGSRGGTAVEEVQRMSVGVDVQTNSLVVSAPEPLLTQVEQLVRQLDQKALDSTNQTIATIRLHHAGPAVVQGAVSAALGEQVTFGSSVASSSRRTTTGRTGRAGASTQAADAQRAALFQMMQMRGMGGGGFGQRGGGFQGGGGGFQGGGGRGGGGGGRGGGGGGRGG